MNPVHSNSTALKSILNSAYYLSSRLYRMCLPDLGGGAKSLRREMLGFSHLLWLALMLFSLVDIHILCSSKLWVPICHISYCHISGDCNPDIHHCENLRSNRYTRTCYLIIMVSVVLVHIFANFLAK